MSLLVLNQLIVTGENKKDAILSFSTGLNVISGSSDTGKTYVFQCLKYLLGSSSKPKENLLEAKGYSDAFLEILVNQIPLTLERSLTGGDVRVHFGTIELARMKKCKFEDLKAEAKGKKNLSKHILDLMGLSGITVVKAKTKGQKAEIHLSDFRDFIFIDEAKIITEGSPFLSDNPTNRSKEVTFLNYLVTGNDYKDIPLVADLDSVKNSILALYIKNQLELEKTKRTSLRDKLSGYKSNENIETVLQSLALKLEDLQSNYNTIQKEKESIQESLIKLKSKSKAYSEIILRFNLLKEQYDVDRKRLDHLNEASDFFQLFKFNQCPICFTNFEEGHQHNIKIGFNVEDYNKSIVSEVKKITLLSRDLDNTIRDTNLQKEAFDSEIEIKTSHIKGHEARQKEISTEIKNSSVKLQNYIDIERLKNEDEQIESRIEKLENELKSYLPVPGQKKKKEPSNIDSVLDEVKVLLSNEFESDLKAINYYAENKVMFDDKKSDFLISGKPRRSFGKGYRAISYSIANLALLSLSSKVNTSMNLMIIDSPLTTHEGKHEKSEGQDIVSKEMEQLFFKLLHEKSSNLQVIVFDNKVPNQELIPKINFIEFTCNDSYGRYGFFPKS